jgi:hypothetical protein
MRSSKIPGLILAVMLGLFLFVGTPAAWGILVWYLGDVEPDSPDSGGPGISFQLMEGEKQGRLVFDPDAVNFRAWYISDRDLVQTTWQSTPEEIIDTIGGTILGRVKVLSGSGPVGGNISIFDDIGFSTGYHWGGPTGYIKETYRDKDTTEIGDNNYHILRATAYVDCAPCGDVKEVMLYFDEDTSPVIQITPASTFSISPDSFGFGAGSLEGTQEIYFDWVTASNQGVFAPGDEVQILGHNLVPTYTVPACDMVILPEATQVSWAVEGQSADPGQIDYVVGNGGLTNISYSVQEVDDQGSPRDFGWLAVAPTGGGPLATGVSETVTASINTTGLPTGVYTAYLKFTDDCTTGINEFTRTIELTVVDWTVTPNPAYDIPACPSGSYPFTVTNTGSADLNYTVQKVGTCDWLWLDKTLGGPLAGGSSDTVTITVDGNGLTEEEACTLEFTNDRSLPDTQIRTVKVNIAANPIVQTYNGDVDPETADSFGTGYTFTHFSGSTKQGMVVQDNDAVDGWAWRMVDDDEHLTSWHSTPFRTVYPNLGATIVARLSVENATGAGRGGNLTVWEGDAGLTAMTHFSGPHMVSPGRVSETRRQTDAPANPDRANTDYHILRLTVGGGHNSGLPRRVRLYFDEDPNPVLVLNTEDPLGYTADDFFGFGATDLEATQTIRFDYINATTAGAFAPGEEQGCLGRSLVTEGKCNNPFADVDGDSDVDQDDFAEFQVCYTGDGFELADGGECFDRDNDNDVDDLDFVPFEACASGPAVPADPFFDGVYLCP